MRFFISIAIAVLCVSTGSAIPLPRLTEENAAVRTALANQAADTFIKSYNEQLPRIEADFVKLGESPDKAKALAKAAAQTVASEVTNELFPEWHKAGRTKTLPETSYKIFEQEVDQALKNKAFIFPRYKKLLTTEEVLKAKAMYATQKPEDAWRIPDGSDESNKAAGSSTPKPGAKPSTDDVDNNTQPKPQSLTDVDSPSGNNNNKAANTLVKPQNLAGDNLANSGDRSIGAGSVSPQTAPKPNAIQRTFGKLRRPIN